jgi:hypothetical protein
MRKIILVLCFAVLSIAVVCYAGGRGGSSKSSSSSSHSGKVHVDGYYRKDGTYVRPYDRNYPGQGPSGDSSTPNSSPSLPSSSSTSSSYSGRNLSSNYGYSTRNYSYRFYHSSGYIGSRDTNGRIARSESAKREFMRETGYPHGRPGYVVDHIIPLKRGGSDTPSNMQWQTVEAAKAKDKWE